MSELMEPRAVKWEVGRDPRNGITRHHIEEREQRDGSIRYAVTDGWAVLNRKGEWVHEPIPSSRTDSFIAQTRYASFDKALAAYRAAAARRPSGAPTP